MKTKRKNSFLYLNVTQFLAAMNDNFFKLLIIMYLTKAGAGAGKVSSLAMGIFVVPFLLFLPYAGNLADRFSKRKIIVWTQAAGVLIVAAGLGAFMLGRAEGLYCVLFLMGTHSAFFGPCKYGIVPELVEKEKLSDANGKLEAMTYLAIIFGMASAPFLLEMTEKLGAGEHRYVIISFAGFLIAAGGLAGSLRIEKTAGAGGTGKASFIFVKDVAHTIWSIHRKKDLLLAVLASAYFLMAAAFVQANLYSYGIEVLKLNSEQSGYLFFIGAVGIGMGSFLAGKLSGRYVEFGIVPIGAIGLSAASLALALIGTSKFAIFFWIIVMGISAGFFIVPLNAFIQLKSPTQRRGKVVAASSFLGWIGVLIAAGIIYGLSELGMSARQLFGVLAVITFILSVVTLAVLPDFMIRFMVLVVTKLCYRIKVTGLENIPSQDGALIVCNHTSYVDALLLGATQQRRIRFMMYRSIYENKWLKPFFRLMKVIPISQEDPPKQIIASIRQAKEAMDDGYLVCIFPEGMITRTGMLSKFKSGFERIMKGTNYPIIPAYIGGLWGSIFSYSKGKIKISLPKILPFPVGIYFGKAMCSESKAFEVRQKVCELSSEFYVDKKEHSKSLPYAFIKAARKNWGKKAICDNTGKRLNFGQTLIGALALSDKIKVSNRDEEKIGILLPPSVGGVLANIAVSMAGKVPVNLNYTASAQARQYAIESCGIKTVIGSRGFIGKVEGIETLPGLVFIEDMAGRIKKGDKVRALLKAVFVPAGRLTNEKKHKADDLATVIFSSGSTGKPKGVMLSHFNIQSNIEALRVVVQIVPSDDMSGVVPFFHAMGFTCALWIPMVVGISASYITNPLDGKAVAESVRENKTTIMFAPPTFVLNFLRRAERDDFASLRILAVGAEKLKASLANAFEEKFGIRPLEGYGATELSPVASLNVPNVEISGELHIGNKPDTVGHPLPGITAKVVDVETLEQAANGTAGLLMIKSSSAMMGYLNMQAESEKVLKDGWYNTGDMAIMDDDGFLKITGRMSRFSKIGGEMVPHGAVEEAYLTGLHTSEQVVVVVGVPDEKKGEQLVVFYLEPAGDAKKLHEIISASELPNIYKPRQENYIKIDAIPLLGSGKIDIIALKKIAMISKGIKTD